MSSWVAEVVASGAGVGDGTGVAAGSVVGATLAVPSWVGIGEVVGGDEGAFGPAQPATMSTAASDRERRRVQGVMSWIRPRRLIGCLSA